MPARFVRPMRRSSRLRKASAAPHYGNALPDKTVRVATACAARKVYAVHALTDLELGWLRRLCAPMLFLLAACADHVNKPEPPDMTELIEAYANPSAELTAETVPQVRAALKNMLVWLLPLCGFSSETLTQACDSENCLFLCHGIVPLQNVLESASNQNDEDARELSRRIRNISGYFELVRICPGHGESQTLYPENGSVVLQVGFTSQGIDPVFGGDVRACKVNVGGLPSTLTGDVALAFDKPFLLDVPTNQQVIIRFRGQIASSGFTEETVSADLQLSAIGGGSLGLSFELPGHGNMVFQNGASGPSIRAQNGVFSCSFPNAQIEQMSCVQRTTGERVP